MAQPPAAQPKTIIQIRTASNAQTTDASDRRSQVRRAARDAQVTNLQDWSESLVATTDPTASRRLRELERALGELADEQCQIILLVGLRGRTMSR